jgi:hypothetical protein
MAKKFTYALARRASEKHTILKLQGLAYKNRGSFVAFTTLVFELRWSARLCEQHTVYRIDLTI